MSFISYSQNLEDVLLWRALKSVHKGFYVDVGAWDPEIDSVTKAFYDAGWNGINIEPVPQWFERIQEKRSRDINLQVAAGEKEGELVIYEIPDTGLSTGDTDTALRHGSILGSTFYERTVPMLPLSSILSSHNIEEIHFLKIDVEGAERSVISGMDFSAFRPWIILVESTAPASQAPTHEKWESLITGKNYDFVYFDGLNRYYLAREHSTLKIHFDTPPNVFDDYVHPRIISLEARLVSAERRCSHLQSMLCLATQGDPSLLLMKDLNIYSFPDYPEWHNQRMARRMNDPQKLIHDHPCLFSVFIDATKTDSTHLVDASLLSLYNQNFKNVEVFLVGSGILSSGIHCKWKERFRSLRGLSVIETSDSALIFNDSSLDARWRGNYALIVPSGTLFDVDTFNLFNNALSAYDDPSPLDLLLCDWDNIVDDKTYGNPVFMPGWDPDMLLSIDYVRQSFLFSPQLRDRIRDHASPVSSSSEWLDRVANSPETLRYLHVAEPLIHFPNASDQLTLRQRPKLVHQSQELRVAIIIPTRNRLELISNCVAFLEHEKSIIPELIIVDNGSTDPEVLEYYGTLKQKFGAKIVTDSTPFNFSRMINSGVDASESPLLLLLNNDVVITKPGLIPEILRNAMRKEVGVVGSKLATPDGRVQHTGILLSEGRLSGHVMRGAMLDEMGYLGLLQTTRNYQAVTAALMGTRRDVFEQVGGFDEMMLPVEYNDVDYCLKVREAGYRVICLPMAGIIHPESSSRKIEILESIELHQRAEATKIMRSRWMKAIHRDPFLNPNVSLSEVALPRLITR